MARASHGVISGTWYYEVEIISPDPVHSYFLLPLPLPYQFSSLGRMKKMVDSVELTWRWERGRGKWKMVSHIGA